MKLVIASVIGRRKVVRHYTLIIWQIESKYQFNQSMDSSTSFIGMSQTYLIKLIR